MTHMTEQDTVVRVARWDGRDLAAVQVATALLPRTEGRPAAEVDADWNLTVYGIAVALGAEVVVSGTHVRVLAPA